jgi:hypothetical protein
MDGGAEWFLKSDGAFFVMRCDPRGLVFPIAAGQFLFKKEGRVAPALVLILRQAGFASP